MTRTALVPLALILWASTALAQAPSAQTILDKSRDNMRLDGAEMVSTLIIRNKAGQERVRKIASVSRIYDGGATEKRLIRFVSPADVKGTGLLTFDYDKKTDDMWFFMPALRKTRRIVASDKAKSFMGSEFTYADITPPPVEDFTHKVLGSKTVAGVDCWEVESLPRDEDVADENGWSKRVSTFGKADYVPRTSTYYDLDGELEKELTAEDVREIDKDKHRFRPMKMTMINKLNGRSSTLDVSDLKLRKDVPDEYFTTRYLERQ